MAYFPDIVYPDFEYPEEMENLIVWGNSINDEVDPYDVNEWFTELAESRRDLTQSMWEAICDDYDIHSDGFTYTTKYQISEVDEYIDSCYEPILIGGIKTDMSEAIFYCQNEVYTEYVISFVEGIVRGLLEQLIETGDTSYGDYHWFVSDKTTDEVIAELGEEEPIEY